MVLKIGCGYVGPIPRNLQLEMDETEAQGLVLPPLVSNLVIYEHCKMGEMGQFEGQCRKAENSVVTREGTRGNHDTMSCPGLFIAQPHLTNLSRVKELIKFKKVNEF